MVSLGHVTMVLGSGDNGVLGSGDNGEFGSCDNGAWVR